jgi:SAM-dependent methyltransferase
MCGSSSLDKAFSLTATPPGNDFLTLDELGRNEPVYPLDLYFCKECHHVQLGHVVDPKILYQKNYSYVSSTSSLFVEHLKVYADDMIDRFNLEVGDLVADIGSNDGTCLSFFQNKGLKVVGVDPAKEIAKNATKNGIETVGDFFSYDLSLKLRERYGAANYITSHNACAHIDNLLDVVKGVEYWLDKDGIFVLEVGYFVDVYQNTWFDTIYHEHLDYHTVAPFEKLFAQVGMEVISVQRVTPQGGSIRIMAQKIGGKFQRDNSVNKLIALEKKLGLDRIETLLEFASNISAISKKLQKLVHLLKRKGKTIAGFGAPTKATTLMAHFGIDENIIDFIVDDNSLKQGLYTPITHIPVLPVNEIYKRKPDYVLILAWNFAEPIMKMHVKYSNEIGRFILPMPDPRVVNEK